MKFYPFEQNKELVYNYLLIYSIFYLIYSFRSFVKDDIYSSASLSDPESYSFDI
jgi:hypothetical protein